MTNWRVSIIRFIHIGLIGLVVLMAIMTAGCSSDIKLPTEDSLIAMKALELVEGIRTAYANKDFSSMARFSTHDTYRGITGGLKSFDSAELRFTPKWVEINREGDAVEILVAWKGLWVVDEETTKKDGTVLFSFSGDPLKISSIKRLSPFSQP